MNRDSRKIEKITERLVATIQESRRVIHQIWSKYLLSDIQFPISDEDKLRYYKAKMQLCEIAANCSEYEDFCGKKGDRAYDACCELIRKIRAQRKTQIR